MKTKSKLIIAVAILIATGAMVLLGFSESRGVVQSCTATYETYVRAHFSERYISVCYSTSTEGKTYSYACTETRYWSTDASPHWITRTRNGVQTTNATEAYISNHGYYINDTPPRDQSMSRQPYFDYFRTGRKVNLEIAVEMPDGYQAFKKSPSFYRACESLRKNKQASVIKLWYGHAYDTEMML